MSFSADAIALLNQQHPGLIAVIGTQATDGFPQLVPVWFRWDGEQIVVWTLETRRWVQNVIRDNRVGVCIAREETGSKALMLRGYASVETGDDNRIDNEIRAITQRYVRDEEVESYVADWPELRTLVKIRPHKHYLWH